MSVANTQQSTNKKLRLLTKPLIFMLKLWLVLVLIVGVVLGLLFTPFGAKLAIDAANDWVSELTIDYQSGGLASELQLASVDWQQLDNRIAIEQVSLSLKLSCVWRLAVCIEAISANKTRIQLGNKSEQAEKPSSALLTMPVPISIENLKLQDFAFDSPGMAAIKWQLLTAKLDFFQRLYVDKIRLDGFYLETYAAPKEQPKQQNQSIDWSQWQYTAIQSMPIQLPIHFDIVDFKMHAAQVKLAGQDQQAINQLHIKAKGTAKKLQIDALNISHQQGQLTAKGHLQLKGDFEHVLHLDANANGLYQSSWVLALRSSGNIQAVSTVLELNQSKAPTAKAANLEIQVNAKPGRANLPLNLALKWQHLKWPPLMAKVSSEKGELDITGDLSALTIKGLTDVASDSLPDSRLDLKAKAHLTGENKRIELSSLSIDTIGGKIVNQGVLTLSESLNWQGQSSLNNLDPSLYWPALDAEISGDIASQVSNVSGVWQAKLNKLDIDGQWQNYPLSVSGQAEYHQVNGLSVQKLRVKNADNQLTLDGSISSQQALDMRFSLDTPDLAKSLPQLDGALNLTGQLSGSIEQPALTYDLSAENIFVSGIFVEKIAGQGKAKWNQQKPVDIRLSAKGIQGVSNQIDSAFLLLEGDAQAHQLTLSTQGLGSSIELAIQGLLTQNTWQGIWLTGEIQSTYANLTLIKPFELQADWASGDYFIAPHCWRHSNNELCIKQAEFKQNIAQWDLSLKEFDLLSVLRRLAPTLHAVDTKSRLNLDTSGKWDINQLPQLDLTARLSAGDWVFNQQNNLQLALDEVLVKAQMSQQQVLTQINLSGSEIGAISGNIIGQTGVYSDPLARPISGDLSIERIDLSALKALTPQLSILQGLINGQAKIDGTLAKPLLTGELKLANGALKGESLPVELSDIEQSILLKGQSADLAGKYRLGKGLGEMAGEIAWSPSLNANLQIKGEQLEFDYQSMIKAKVSPDIHILFAPNNLEIKGDVAVPYARIKVRDLPKGSLSPTKDVILMEEKAQQEQQAQKLALDLLINIDANKTNQVKLDAFGLTSDLQGQLRLKNNKSEIFGSGELQLVNGKYKAYGQNLLIKEGDILFTSSLDRPYLNIEAVRDPDLTADGVVAGLRVEGAAQNPKVSVFSEPAMEQQQALSYMLTGQGLGQSNGDSQDTVLTNALLSLGLGKSENLISKVGNKLGFEDVNLDTTGQGQDTQLSLSGTIAPGVQLRYGVGVFGSISEVALRYELWPKLYLEAVSGVGTAIDIYYQFSIEGKANKRIMQKNSTDEQPK